MELTDCGTWWGRWGERKHGNRIGGRFVLVAISQKRLAIQGGAGKYNTGAKGAVFYSRMGLLTFSTHGILWRAILSAILCEN